MKPDYPPSQPPSPELLYLHGLSVKQFLSVNVIGATNAHTHAHIKFKLEVFQQKRQKQSNVNNFFFGCI